MAHLSMGNPHSVVGVDEVAVVDLADLGGKVPQINLEIVEPGPELHAITMRVHERGAGITQACGTGACAAAFASKQWGLVNADRRRGARPHGRRNGDRLLRPRPTDRAILTGPATHIATIEVPLT